MPEQATLSLAPDTQAQATELRFSIDTKVLLAELATVQGVASKKDSNGMLSHVLVETDGGDRITMLGTDIDLSLKTSAEAEVRGHGAIAVNAHKLFEIVRNLPAGTIRVASDGGGSVVIDAAKSRFRLSAGRRELFPAVPDWPGARFAIAADVFATLVSRTLFAVAKDSSLQAIRGALLRLDGNCIRMAATDGHRLAVVDATGLAPAATAGPETAGALVPRKTVAELLRLAASADDPVEIARSDNHVFFRIGHRVLVSRVLAGEFPDYERVMPKQTPNAFRIDCRLLDGAIRRVALMADGTAGARPVRLAIANRQLAVHARSPEAGEACETLDIDFEGGEFEISLNAPYLSEFLSAAGQGDVAVEFTDAASAVLMRPAEAGGPATRYVVMPLRR